MGWITGKQFKKKKKDTIRFLNYESKLVFKHIYD